MRTPAIGSKTFLRLLNTHTPKQLFAESERIWQQLGLKEQTIAALKQPDWKTVEADVIWSTQTNNAILSIDDADYPPLLKELPDAPPLLFVRGNKHLLSSPQIAIVGSRNPSTLGKQTAFDFAKSLTQCGFSITSGLALGIDAASHQGALSVGGNTVAVIGTGLDRVYPAKHKDLATEIVEKGVMVSEFPLGTQAKAHHFPMRNRIISGLSEGLLVVEAAKQSGSLITARLALEQNREVFAIPGSIHNPLARGCNALIREGAKLVETTQDILEELTQYNQQHENFVIQSLQSTLDLEQQTLLNRVAFSPTNIDDLVRDSGKSVEFISSILLLLELQGYIEATAGGCYVRIK